MAMTLERIQESGFGIQGKAAGAPNLTARIAAAAIRSYQRWISPHKGFVCAHRRLHGGHSCSEFARLAVLEQGVLAALPNIRRQFAECHDAARALRRTARHPTMALARLKRADRSMDDRIYEDSERKRKRLDEMQGEGHTTGVGDCFSSPEWCLAGDLGCEALACLSW